MIDSFVHKVLNKQVFFETIILKAVNCSRGRERVVEKSENLNFKPVIYPVNIKFFYPFLAFILFTIPNERVNAWIYEEIDGVRVIQNQVFDGEYLWIDGAEWDGVIIRNNLFKNQIKQALRIKNAYNVLIENNEFTEMLSFAIKLAEHQTRGTDNIEIRNNYFHDTYYIALYTGEPNTNAKIIGNTFENVTLKSTDHKQHAIYVKGPDFHIEGNVITNVPGGHAVSVRTSGLVRGNILKGAHEFGIKYFSDGIRGNGQLTIENNISYNNRLGGISVDYSSNTVEELDKIIIRFNTVVNNSLGVWLDKGFAGLNIELYGNIIVEGNQNYFNFEMIPFKNIANLTSPLDIGFIDLKGGNFQLLDTSVAVNFVTGIPAQPKYDFSGNPMEGEPFDAGAYQH